MTAAAAALTALVLAGCGTTGIADRFTEDASAQVLVQIRDSGIHPAEARVRSGGRVAWVNDSTLYSVAIFLPRDVVERLGCAELRPSFTRVADGYRSEPLESGGEETLFPCPLPPGEYTYRVQFFEGFTTGTPVSPGLPYHSEEARIIVGEGAQ